MNEPVPHHDLVPMDLFIASAPLKIDLVYADAGHAENIFNQALYHKDARLILHRDLAKVVVATSRFLFDAYGHTLVLKDGLRPIEAQAAMAETQIVKNNPHWLVEPNILISSAGVGGHPRGMAVDVALETEAGTQVDMGTVFDTMTEESARNFNRFPESILANRKMLEDAFVVQAQQLSLPVLPLPSEWWDFRFPRQYTGQWSAISDKDLPGPLKMIATEPDHTGEWVHRFDKAVKEVLNSV